MDEVIFRSSVFIFYCIEIDQVCSIIEAAAAAEPLNHDEITNCENEIASKFVFS